MAPWGSWTVGVGTLPGRPVMSVLNASCPADAPPTVLCAGPVGAWCSVTEVAVIVGVPFLECRRSAALKRCVREAFVGKAFRSSGGRPGVGWGWGIRWHPVMSGPWGTAGWHWIGQDQ